MGPIYLTAKSLRSTGQPNSWLSAPRICRRSLDRAPAAWEGPRPSGRRCDVLLLNAINATVIVIASNTMMIIILLLSLFCSRLMGAH